MRRSRVGGVVALVLASLVLLMPGCLPGPSSQEGQSKLEGTITVSGAWALYPMMVRWGEEFQKQNPGVQLDISAGGAGKGIADALAGAVDIGMVSRAITGQEEQAGAFWVPVTIDAVFPTANAKNPVLDDLTLHGVSRETFIGIYITGEVVTWGQVVGRPEVTEPIHVYTRSDAAGAPETWAKYLDKRQEDLLGVGVYGDPGLMEAVVKDALGIGYNNMGYAFDAATGRPVNGAVVLPIDVNGNGKVDPDEVLETRTQARDAVAEGRYPSPPARQENLVTKGKPSGLTRAFIVWIVTDGQKFVDDAGYVPLSRAVLDEALKKLD
jgi:phosphate transport system substrate-binding protein